MQKHSVSILSILLLLSLLAMAGTLIAHQYGPKDVKNKEALEEAIMWSTVSTNLLTVVLLLMVAMHCCKKK